MCARVLHYLGTEYY